MLKHLIHNYNAPQLANRAKYAISASSNGALVFAKSTAYMNESSVLLGLLLRTERIGSQHLLLVLYDDFEAPLGTVRLQNFKKQESHNGIKSVQKCLLVCGVRAYKLGIGIGPKPQGASSASMASWVLSPMAPQEKAVLDHESLDLLIAIIELVVEMEGEPGDVNKFNARAKKMIPA